MNLTPRQIEVLETLRENKRAYVMRKWDRKTKSVRGGALVFAGPGGGVIRADRLKSETVNGLVNARDKSDYFLQTVKCGLGQGVVINHYTLSPAGLEFLKARDKERKAKRG